MANALQQALQRNYMEDARTKSLDTRLDQIKASVSHVGLYVGLVLYTAVGAWVSPGDSLRN